MTNSVTFENASVYCGCQEAGRIREESTPTHLPLNQMKAGWCSAQADVGIIRSAFTLHMSSRANASELKPSVVVLKNNLSVPFQHVTFPFSESFPELCHSLPFCLQSAPSTVWDSLINTVHYLQSGSDSTEFLFGTSVSQLVFFFFFFVMKHQRLLFTVCVVNYRLLTNLYK